MSRVPLGKVLLRNVIRHTDAHNKIQEESDMWKIRELERQMEDAYRGTKRKMSPSSSSRMRSDGFDEESQRDYWRPKNEISGALEDDFLKAKSWNKKLYDYEANMPDRWGHSGYKELYPEEFETDSSDQQDITNGKKKSPQIKPSSHESHKHKKSKKSHKKKQKKKSRKKQKKSKKEATDVTADSSKAESDTPQSDDSASSSSEDSEDRDTQKSERQKKGKEVRVPAVNSEAPGRTSRRTDWKVATDERSAESSDDD
nr:uncharacterized protein NKAPD1 isoform X4 [Manis javanica]